VGEGALEASQHSWILGRAGRILLESGEISGLELEDGAFSAARPRNHHRTFLNGLVHVGREQRPAGRADEPPSCDLAESIKSLKFRWGRSRPERRRGSRESRSILKMA
jgi:tRNA uridine 5-carboxymethylaminomethyl modification enzyme